MTLTGRDRAATFLKSIQKNLNIKIDPNQPIDKNAKPDTGSIKTLRRAISGEAKHLRDVYSIVLTPLEYSGIKYTQDNSYHQDEWIFVTCLFADYPQKLDQDGKFNFGHSAGALAKATHSEGADRRFRALLDTSLEDLRSPLSALVRLMKSKGIAIDYPQLIVDLCRWEHPDQYIQDKWARAFWGAPPKTPEESTDEPDELGEEQ
jgi:CRISPR system Cascade subunit CasB